jgi:ketosteroid isomerase-like protein
MNRLSILALITALLLPVGVTAYAGFVIDQAKAQQTSDAERVNAASQTFTAAIGARDILAIDKVWAHEPYATFIGPLSTVVVVGWDGVRKAWEMRFGQFDKVTISVTESHVHANEKIAWAVGMERIQLLRKDGKTVAFDAFVTNVFENHDGQWLMVSHQSTPVFSEAK